MTRLVSPGANTIVISTTPSSATFVIRCRLCGRGELTPCGSQALADFNLSDPGEFMDEMAQSAAEHGLTIQYC
ncbi:MAG TPA: hypothetical protein VK335_04855 [Bryobacteraceae bacterium]|nr:hypothetical protein [Bryobacteraceae bacterium]